MTIRWRLSIAAVQLITLGFVTHWTTGNWVVGDTWFLAGLLAVVVNPQILEPWFSSPRDVLANTIIGAVLYSITPKTATALGWNVFLVFIAVFGVTSLLALILGASRRRGPGVRLGRVASTVSRVASATVIYSAIFWLSLLEYRPLSSPDFWRLAAGWGAIVLVGSVNWQDLWSTITDRPGLCEPTSGIGPSVLNIVAPALPSVGSVVRLSNSGVSTLGTVMNRIQRTDDVWGSVFVPEAVNFEELLTKEALDISVVDREEGGSFVGAVDAGSSVSSLSFVAVKPLELGHVVKVSSDEEPVLYQVTEAKVEKSTVSGGAQYIVRAHAAQLGRFITESQELRRYRWVPPVGGAVRRAEGVADDNLDPPPGHFTVGTVIGTEVPLYLRLSELNQGHLAILGMTRMGKTSFALRLAERLGNDHRVTILDQSKEYVGRRGLPTYEQEHEEHENGISVLEPADGTVPADRAFAYLDWLTDIASEEYAEDQECRRTVLIDEAHQFVPEPAVLGYNSPGRDSAVQFGLQMMQIRKYGISTILVSQRTAVVAKSALSQCENVVAFKTVDKTGLEYLETLIGQEARSLLPELNQGEAIAFGPAFTSEGPVAVDIPSPADRTVG